MLAASTRLGPYVILAPLGAGGMGEVYRARDSRLGREVAIKVLPETLAHDRDRRARFEREARAVAALSHPNILAIHDYGEEGGVTYAVMELLEGETLRSRLATGPMPWPEAAEIGAEVAEGLAAACARGIIHRDLKPENIFLTGDGHTKILDFGLARFVEQAGPQSETGPYAADQTEPGVVMGTVGYMSPEQVRGQPVDARSDLFALGCILYEMFTGQRAFRRATAAETMTAILHDEPPDPASSGSPIPAELGRVIRQCLAKSPSRRLQSAHDLALSLRATAGAAASDRSLAAHPSRRPPAVALAAVGLVAVLGGLIHVLTRGGGGGWPESGTHSTQAPHTRAVETLAILPFDNVGGDPNLDHLSDGIPDTIIHGLSRLRHNNLKVRPFTSVARYRGKKPEVRDVGRDLNVAAIVTGRLLQRADGLSISVALIDVREESELWGKRYDGTLSELLSLQDEITKDIAAHLRLRLTGDEDRRLAHRPTDNPEAYHLYLKGRYFWNKRTRADLEKAIEYFRSATDIDPNYAEAWAGLADSYNYLGYGNYLSPQDSFPRGEAAAKRACALDDTLADPHASLGFVRMYWDWKFPEAEQEFRRAIERNPNSANARHLYSLYLTAMQRWGDARREIERAQVFDPLSVPVATDMGFELHYMGRDDEAIPRLRAALEMDPAFPLAHFWLGRIYTMRGQYDQARGELEAVNPALREWQPAMAAKGYLFGVWGKRTEARAVLDHFQALRKNGHFATSYGIALVYTALGENDQAFAWLDRAVEERSHWLVWLALDPRWNTLHPDPRFQSLLKRVGLTQTLAHRDPADSPGKLTPSPRTEPPNLGP